MIRIPAEIRAKLEVVIGDPQQVSCTPAPVFDPLRIDFLADLSRVLLAYPQARELPDVVTFAYWCRRANLAQLANRYRAGDAQDAVRLGLGLSFHICPSNVPVNFAFSLAFGLLSGNACVLRLSSKPAPATERIVAALTQLLGEQKYAEVAEGLLVLRFERDDDVNRFWLTAADARVVWGGDATVEHMRSLPCRPRSREVAFPDRYSFCVLEPHAVLALDHAEMLALCGRLYNDLYLMDQAACSSPQLVAWIGAAHDVVAAQARLWPALAQYARSRYAASAVQMMDKYVDACRHAVSNERVLAVEQHGNVLYRIGLSELAQDQDSRRGYFGTIHEVTLASLDALAPFVNERYQTLTYFGLERTALRDFVVAQRLRGVDRVVPVGRALDMNIVWDGYDIVASLSRVVDIQ
ncbi:acyl-CoA reductase [Paraburkholderia sp. Ac-20340]|uniref:acyl-CoA reductase n=1 Tax=Paraburkholderia sp. Ac-20340 TaxID=2703888 RepID=UPI00197DC45A|nr:acyl-CoA reductase [Paraburkholderia sp. Ac-20340]